MELINMVNNDQVTIKAAAKQLGINYSTAKHIYKQHSLANDQQKDSDEFDFDPTPKKGSNSKTEAVIPTRTSQRLAQSLQN